MAKTRGDLYRAIIDGTFAADVDMCEERPVEGVLYPRTEAETHIDRTGREFTRRADMTVFTVGEDTMVDIDGGTVLFDVAGWYGFVGWRYFQLPEGTIIPNSLVIEESRRVILSRDGSRTGRRHVVVPATRMPIGAYRAALDHLARNAVVRQIELAR